MTAEIEQISTFEIEKFNNTQKDTLTIVKDFESLDLFKQAEYLVNSKLLPGWIKTPEQAMIAIQYAKELKLPALSAIKSMYIVNGVPTLTAFLMGALIRKNGNSYRYSKVMESVKDVNGTVNDAIVTIESVRKDDPFKDEKGNNIVYTTSYKWSEAAAQGLTSKDNWKKMPEAMMKARCLSKMAREVFPDIIMGFYLPDELDSSGKISYDDEGNLLIIK